MPALAINNIYILSIIMRFLLLLMIVTISLSAKTYGQSSEVEKIDTTISQCMNDKHTTSDLKGCISYGDSLMDLLLNKTYKQLLKQLKQEDLENLKKSQREWLAFYNLEVYFIYESFTTYANHSKYETGMEQNIDNVMKVYRLKRERVSQLVDYLAITSVD